VAEVVVPGLPTVVEVEGIDPVVVRPHSRTSVLVAEVVAEVVAVRVARSEDVIEIVTTVGEPERFWLGGRESHNIFEDDWAWSRSWFFTKQLFPICSCEWSCQQCRDSLRVSLKLTVAGSHKGRCRPTTAWVKIGIGQDKHGRYEVDLGRQSVRSVKQAQKWADGHISDAAIKIALRQFYSTLEPAEKKRGKLIEKLEDDLGWCEWLWSFEEYPDWSKLSNYQPMRITDHEGRTSLIKPWYGGYSISSWPSKWDRVKGFGNYGPGRDEYGTL
jgi:hypothetical protein